MDSKQMYLKYAPRWFKVIRWREMASRFAARQKELVVLFYLPLYFFYFHNEHPFSLQMLIKRPRTEEEILELKQNTIGNKWQRNWELNEHIEGAAPPYDLSKRRLKYPEYYEGRYNKKIPNVWGVIED